MNGYMITAALILSMVFTAIAALVTYMCFPIGVILTFSLFSWAMLSIVQADNRNDNGNK